MSTGVYCHSDFGGENMSFRDAWYPLLGSEARATADSLLERLQSERERGERICPTQENVMRALDMVAPDDVKVVILGQDPYHTPEVASGLAFSVDAGVKLPPSMRNIRKELVSDIGGEEPVTGDLTPWARQGVLLLNTVLSVYEGRPYSHGKWGWQTVTKDILRVCTQAPQPVVFLLWGGYAHKFAEGILEKADEKKLVYKTSHPSPLGARKGNAQIPAFLGSRPFSLTNEFLALHGSDPIDWRL